MECGVPLAPCVNSKVYQLRFWLWTYKKVGAQVIVMTDNQAVWRELEKGSSKLELRKVTHITFLFCIGCGIARLTVGVATQDKQTHQILWWREPCNRQLDSTIILRKMVYSGAQAISLDDYGEEDSPTTVSHRQDRCNRSIVHGNYLIQLSTTTQPSVCLRPRHVEFEIWNRKEQLTGLISRSHWWDGSTPSW